MRRIEPNNADDPYRLKMEIKFSEKEYNFEGEVSKILNKQLLPGDKPDLKFNDQEFIV
jgi:hypothetical protein